MAAGGRRVTWWQAGLFLAGVKGIDWLSAREAATGEGGLYDAQWRPRWSPPSWVFAPAWLAINATQLVGDARLLNRPSAPRRRAQLAAHAAAWTSYAAFSPLYFGLKSPVLGAATTYVGWAASLASVSLAWRSDRRVALAYMPFLAWTSYASVVATAVARRNPDRLLGRPGRAPGVTVGGDSRGGSAPRAARSR